MKKKEKMGIVILAIGILILMLASNDMISILADAIGKVVRIDLPVIYFSSFSFRIGIICLGGMMMLIAAILLKHIEKL